MPEGADKNAVSFELSSVPERQSKRSNSVKKG